MDWERCWLKGEKEGWKDAEKEEEINDRRGNKERIKGDCLSFHLPKRSFCTLCFKPYMTFWLPHTASFLCSTFWVENSAFLGVKAYYFRSLRSTHWLCTDDCYVPGQRLRKHITSNFCLAANRLTGWQETHHLEHHHEGNIQCARLFLGSVITHTSDTEVHDAWWCPQRSYLTCQKGPVASHRLT